MRAQFCAVAGGLFACLIALAFVPTPAIAQSEIQAITSPAGIEAWLVEEDTVPLIAMTAIWDGGAAQDPKEREGTSSMLAQLLDQGAGEMDAAAFQTRVEELAIRLSFDTGKDNFSAALRTLPGAADEAFSLLGLALTEPRLDDSAVERVRRQLMTAYAMGEDDPGTLASRAFTTAIYPDHPYGRLTDGTPESLQAIGKDDLSAMAEKMLARDNLHIAIVGPVSPEKAGELIDRAFGGLSRKADLATIPPATPAAAEMIVDERDFPQSVARFGMQGLKREDPDFIPAYVMNYVLGGGSFSSRLMEEVREQRGLAYSVWSALSPFKEGGLWLGQVATRNESFGQSLSIIEGEIAKMAKTGITADELADAKTYLTGSYPLRFSSNQEIAEQLAGIKFADLGIDYVDMRNALIEAVTLEDIDRVAKRLLDPDALLVTVVGQPILETDASQADAASPEGRSAQ